MRMAGLVPTKAPLSPALSPLVPRGEREKKFWGRVTQGVARSSLALGYHQVIPNGIAPESKPDVLPVLAASCGHIRVSC